MLSLSRDGEERFKVHSTYLFLRMCARDGRPFWAWERETWLRVLGISMAEFFTMHKPGNPDRLAPIHHRGGLPARLLQRLAGIGRDRDGEPGVQSLWARTG